MTDSINIASSLIPGEDGREEKPEGDVMSDSIDICITIVSGRKIKVFSKV